MAHLFDRFYRGDAAHLRASGTGSGLWIARHLLAVQQGRIWAENRTEPSKVPGEPPTVLGARFTVRLPYARE